jgi:hypothetical protein
MRDSIIIIPWADIDSTQPWSSVFKDWWEIYRGDFNIFWVDRGVRNHIDVCVKFRRGDFGRVSL